MICDKAHRRSPAFSLLLVLITFLGLDIRPVLGQEVIAIKSQDLPLYQLALDGFKKIYSGKLEEFTLRGDPNPLERIGEAIQSRSPYLILSIGLLATQVAKANFQQTPILFCMLFDPERFSLSGPNMTGITLEPSPAELFPRTKAVLPAVKRIGVLYDPEKSGKLIDEATKDAEALGISLVAAPVSSDKALPNAMRTLLGKIDLLWMVPDSTVVTPQSLDFLFLFSFENNIPILGFSEDLVRRGAVLAFSPDYTAIGEQAGRLALKILGGEDPGRLPLRPAEHVRLSINLKTAAKLGIKLSPSALRSADKVYE